MPHLEPLKLSVPADFARVLSAFLAPGLRKNEFQPVRDDKPLKLLEERFSILLRWSDRSMLTLVVLSTHKGHTCCSLPLIWSSIEHTHNEIVLGATSLEVLDSMAFAMPNNCERLGLSSTFVTFLYTLTLDARR